VILVRPEQTGFVSTLFCGAYVTCALVCDWPQTAGSWCVSQGVLEFRMCLQVCTLLPTA